ncbi:MAG: ABC transporter ATP-binding protein [Ruminococcaceae bacterium]|nr:ABC transporter ATP-binding protein [Oscillospiraceae bacterium]
MKLLASYLKPFAPRMLLGLVIKVGGTMAELLLPMILSHVLKVVVARQDIYAILRWGGIMILCALLAVIMNIIANRMATRVSCNFSRAVRHDLFRRTLHLSAAQTDRFTIPSLESRITTDTYNVHQFVGMAQRMGVRAPILLVGGVCITLFMDRHLAAVMLALMPVVFLLIFFISRKGVPLFTQVQSSVDNMIRVVREDTQGIRVIKALSKQDYEHRRYDAVNRALVRSELRARTVMSLLHPVMNILMNGGIVAVVSLAAFRVSGGTSDPETVIAFMQYFTQISMALMTVNRMFTMYTKCAASARRIAEVLQTPEDLTVRGTDEFPNRVADAHIEFDHVNFSYLGRKNNLDDISFSLSKGGWLGIIGATGSGKSTLVKLLLRFYDVDSGAVRISGRDVRTIPKDELYGMFGTAMQFDFLYSDTVEENIKFGRDLTHEQVVDAAITAQAHDFISAFSDGYEHTLSQKATNISGGQKQRLLIARAVAAAPDILVLDDSSSALDYKTDAALRQALARRMKDTTVVTVAQRVSSVKNCDLILVMDEGRIIGAGDHEHLLATCAEYAEISQSQMGGAFVE